MSPERPTKRHQKIMTMLVICLKGLNDHLHLFQGSSGIVAIS